MPDLSHATRAAADAIGSAGALLIGAGAGMGVDSGLPDFRGAEGFWKAYPMFRDQGLEFTDLANPVWFERDPVQAWGFYGHRLNLYRATRPHAGFAQLLKLGAAMPAGVFVYTSNVDGQFQSAGFADDDLVECHGSIHHLQCAGACSDEIWAADDLVVEVSPTECRAVGELPLCPACGRVARPNILMFGDGAWLEQRTAAQVDRFAAWLQVAGDYPIVKLEFGAGTSVPSVRLALAQIPGTLIRVNPRECDVADDGIGLVCGAQEAIDRIVAALT